METVVLLGVNCGKHTGGDHDQDPEPHAATTLRRCLPGAFNQVGFRVGHERPSSFKAGISSGSHPALLLAHDSLVVFSKLLLSTLSARSEQRAMGEGP